MILSIFVCIYRVISTHTCIHNNHQKDGKVFYCCLSRNLPSIHNTYLYTSPNEHRPCQIGVGLSFKTCLCSVFFLVYKPSCKHTKNVENHHESRSFPYSKTVPFPHQCWCGKANDKPTIWMIYSTHLWWFWGWFMALGLPHQGLHQGKSSPDLQVQPRWVTLHGRYFEDRPGRQWAKSGLVWSPIHVWPMIPRLQWQFFPNSPNSFTSLCHQLSIHELGSLWERIRPSRLRSGHVTRSCLFDRRGVGTA